MGGGSHYHQENFISQQPSSVWPEVGWSPEGIESCRTEAVWWPRVLIPFSRSFLARLAYISQEPARTLPPSPLFPISPPLPGGREQFSAPAPVRGLLGNEVPDAYTGPVSLTAD